MDIIINFDVKISIPQSSSSSKVYLSLARQFKVPFNMVLFIKTQIFMYEPKIKILDEVRIDVAQRTEIEEEQNLPALENLHAFCPLLQ